ncbi:MAG TPA: hypothetical protein VNA31_00885 [bacterium]|nr:hypothetical protein [bacterium]
MARPVQILLMLLVIVVVAWFAYRLASREAFVALGPLAPPPAGPLVFAGQTPRHPFHLEGDSVLARTVFATATPSNAHVEIRDVVLRPNAKSQLPALPGPAVIEVYSGEGSVTVGRGETGERLTSERIHLVPGGQVLSFDGVGARPLVLRLYVFEAK